MEILLWLAPAALVTLLAAWGAAAAARREEEERARRESARPSAAEPRAAYDDDLADGGVSAPRPARRVAEGERPGSGGRDEQGRQGPQRRSA